MIELLADASWSYRLGSAAADLIFPVAGALLLAYGIRRRRAYRRRNRDDDESHDDEFDDADPYDVFDGLDEDLPPRPRRPSRPSGNGTVLIVVGAVVLLLGTGRVLSDLAPPDTTPAVNGIEVGQCISADAYQQRRTDLEAIDCGRADAVLQLASKGDGTATCPDRRRENTKYLMLSSDVRARCFIPNLREGQCYAISAAIAAVSCTDPTATVHVIRRLDGTSEAAGCPAEARVLSYTEPPRTFCFGAPTNK